jgi:nicotinic acetylcholine receptor
MLRGITSESQSICVEDSIGNTRDNELMKIQRMSTTASSDAVNNINIANANCGLTQQLITDLKTKTKRSTNNGNKSTTSGLSAKMSSQEELSQILKYLLWRQEIEDQHNRMVHEWRLLALAVDKVLFWVFLIITLVSSLSFLVIIPIQRRGFPF